MRKFLQCLGLAMLLCLSGCYKKPQTSIPYVNKTTKYALMGAAGGAALGSLSGLSVVGAVIAGTAGAVIGHEMGARMPERTHIAYLLAGQGIQVINLGQDYKIVLYADKFFYGRSPRLQDKAIGALGLVARYLRSFHPVTISVAGYTDNTGNQDRNLALSRAQAQTVVSYLWRQKLDTRLLFAVGYGDAQPIANNTDSEGQAMNRRIEITFRRMVA